MPDDTRDRTTNYCYVICISSQVRCIIECRESRVQFYAKFSVNFEKWMHSKKITAIKGRHKNDWWMIGKSKAKLIRFNSQRIHSLKPERTLYLNTKKYSDTAQPFSASSYQQNLMSAAGSIAIVGWNTRWRIFSFTVRALKSELKKQRYREAQSRSRSASECVEWSLLKRREHSKRILL